MLGDPRPRVVIGLASVVTQLEVDTAHGRVQLVAVGDGRCDCLRRQERGLVAGPSGSGRSCTEHMAELAGVDRTVVPVGEPVSGQASGHRLVADHLGAVV